MLFHTSYGVLRTAHWSDPKTFQIRSKISPKQKQNQSRPLIVHVNFWSTLGPFRYWTPAHPRAHFKSSAGIAPAKWWRKPGSVQVRPRLVKVFKAPEGGEKGADHFHGERLNGKRVLRR